MPHGPLGDESDHFNGMMTYNVREEGSSCTECTTSRVDDACGCVGGIVSSVCNDRFDVMSLFVVFVLLVSPVLRLDAIAYSWPICTRVFDDFRFIASSSRDWRRRIISLCVCLGFWVVFLPSSG